MYDLIGGKELSVRFNLHNESNRCSLQSIHSVSCTHVKRLNLCNSNQIFASTQLHILLKQIKCTLQFMVHRLGYSICNSPSVWLMMSVCILQLLCIYLLIGQGKHNHQACIVSYQSLPQFANTIFLYLFISLSVLQPFPISC